MGFEYVNRRGERYFLLQGKTTTGKAKYYVSRKPEGVPVDQVPEGYEIWESPERGIVSIRKTRSSPIRAEERALVEKETREQAGIQSFRVDIQGDSLVVYAPEVDPARSVSMLSRLFGAFPGAAEAEQEWIGKRAYYHALLCFTLIDETKRLFSVERWCFRGGIDDWHFLAGRATLESHARKYLPHLNKESFFELF